MRNSVASNRSHHNVSHMMQGNANNSKKQLNSMNQSQPGNLNIQQNYKNAVLVSSNMGLGKTHTAVKAFSYFFNTIQQKTNLLMIDNQGIQETFLQSNLNVTANIIENNLQHLIVLNSNQHILLNKSFKTILLIEANPNFYQIIKKIINRIQKQNKSYKAEQQKRQSINPPQYSNINLIHSLNNERIQNNQNNENSNSYIKSNNYKFSKTMNNSNTRKLSQREMNTPSINRSVKSNKMIFTFNSTFNKDKNSLIEENSSKVKSSSPSKKQRSTLESKYRNNNKENRNSLYENNLEKIIETKEMDTRNNFKKVWDLTPKKNSYTNINNVNNTVNAYITNSSSNKKSEVVNNMSNSNINEVSNYLKNIEENTLLKKNPLPTKDSKDAKNTRNKSNFDILNNNKGDKKPLKNNFVNAPDSQYENYFNSNIETKHIKSNNYHYTEIDIYNQKLVILSIDSLFFVAIFADNSDSNISRMVLMHMYIAFCNFDFHRRLFYDKFLVISDINVIKLKVFEIVWIQNLINHFYQCLNKVLGFNEVFLQNSSFNNFYLLSLSQENVDRFNNDYLKYSCIYCDNSWLKNFICFNFNESKNISYYSEYLFNLDILKEIIFQSIKLKQSIDEHTNDLQTEKTDFNKWLIKIEFSTTFPRLVFYIKYIPILNGFVSVHSYIQYKLSRTFVSKNNNSNEDNNNFKSNVSKTSGNSLYYTSDAETSYNEVNILLLDANSEIRLNNASNANNQSVRSISNNNTNNMISKNQNDKVKSLFKKSSIKYDEPRRLSILESFFAEFYFTYMKSIKLHYNEEFIPKYYDEVLLDSVHSYITKYKANLKFSTKINIYNLHPHINRVSIYSGINPNSQDATNKSIIMTKNSFSSNSNLNLPITISKKNKHSGKFRSSFKNNNSLSVSPTPSSPFIGSNSNDNIDMILNKVLKSVFLNEEEYINSLNKNFQKLDRNDFNEDNYTNYYKILNNQDFEKLEYDNESKNLNTTSEFNEIYVSSENFTAMNKSKSTNPSIFYLSKKEILKTIIEYLIGSYDDSSYLLNDEYDNEDNNVNSIFLSNKVNDGKKSIELTDLSKIISNLSIEKGQKEKVNRKHSNMNKINLLNPRFKQLESVLKQNQISDIGFSPVKNKNHKRSIVKNKNLINICISNSNMKSNSPNTNIKNPNAIKIDELRKRSCNSNLNSHSNQIPLLLNKGLKVINSNIQSLKNYIDIKSNKSDKRFTSKNNKEIKNNEEVYKAYNALNPVNPTYDSTFNIMNFSNYFDLNPINLRASSFTKENNNDNEITVNRKSTNSDNMISRFKKYIKINRINEIVFHSNKVISNKKHSDILKIYKRATTHKNVLSSFKPKDDNDNRTDTVESELIDFKRNKNNDILSNLSALKVNNDIENAMNTKFDKLSPQINKHDTIKNLINEDRNDANIYTGSFNSNSNKDLENAKEEPEIRFEKGISKFNNKENTYSYNTHSNELNNKDDLETNTLRERSFSLKNDYDEDNDIQIFKNTVPTGEREKKIIPILVSSKEAYDNDEKYKVIFKNKILTNKRDSYDIEEIRNITKQNTNNIKNKNTIDNYQIFSFKATPTSSSMLPQIDTLNSNLKSKSNNDNFVSNKNKSSFVNNEYTIKESDYFNKKNSLNNLDKINENLKDSFMEFNNYKENDNNSDLHSKFDEKINIKSNKNFSGAENDRIESDINNISNNNSKFNLLDNRNDHSNAVFIENKKSYLNLLNKNK